MNMQKNRTVNYFYFLIILLSISISLSAQNREVGTWKYYVNPRSYTEIENINNNLFLNGKRVIYDVSLNPTEVVTWDKTNHLSDYNVATMSYDPGSKKLLIAYENTILDIVNFKNDKQVFTPNYDIHNKIIVGDKSIQQIKFFNNRAYLCSKMGIIVFNTDRNEIESTYIIGANGDMEAVNTLEIVGDKIYAATKAGLKIGVILPAINLQDYRNWNTTSNIPQDSFIRSSQIGNMTYWMSEKSFYEFDGAAYTQFVFIDTKRKLVNLRKIDNKLYLIYDSLNADNSHYSSKVMKWESGTLSPFAEFKDRKLYDIAIKDGKYYYTGYYLYEQNSSNTLSEIRLRELPYDNPFNLQLGIDEKIFVSQGVMQSNLDAGLGTDGHYIYEKNWWARSGLWSDSLIGCTNEISTIERDGGVYRAFVRGGVAFEKAGQPSRRFSKSNSKLENNSGEYFISAMEYNPIDSSIWIANWSSSKPLKCIKSDGKWYEFDISMITNSTQISKIIIDRAGNKWLLMRGDGVILFNEKDIKNLNDNVVKQITEIKGKDCVLSIQRPFCGVLDRNDNLWIGSEKGIGMITNCTYDPDVNCIYHVPAQSIKNPNDTTVYNECVFLNTSVTALAVDGGNNLWLGTDDGVFYNQEELQDEFIRLNKLNSPFSAKSVYDILVHPRSGEVFIATEIGLLSYMGQSTDADLLEGEDPYKIFPNPVMPDFEGLVTIDGLPSEAYYKITDVSGNLMYQGRSNGSRVTWDCRTLNGTRVPTGVYYIFSSKSLLKGNQGIGKFTVIR